MVHSQIQNVIKIFGLYELSGKEENPLSKRRKIEVPPEYVRIKASKTEV